MKIKSFVFNPFYENTYVIWGDDKQCVVVDPGCYEKFEIDELCSFIESEHLEVQMIINTHCHVDHVLGNYVLKEKYGCPLWIPENEQVTYEAVTVRSKDWGIHRYTKGEPDQFIKDGDKISVGGITFQVIECPGHSPGHQVFYSIENNVVIGGDVLFRQSIGRTDLPGGNHEQLLTNIKTKLYTLPEETVVYPGHGPETTIGFEKTNNPFVRA